MPQMEKIFGGDWKERTNGWVQGVIATHGVPNEHLILIVSGPKTGEEVLRKRR